MTTRLQKKALICGSVAFDTIMVFEDRFRNHILPDKIHMLNVSFLVPRIRREFGGCAGNIAYNLHLLGDVGYPMATVGHDFGPYAQWMQERGVPGDHIRVIDDEHTAQGFVTTDLDDNQIWAFHPGAMQQAHVNQVSEASDVAIGIVAPDGREGMLQHAAQFAAQNTPFIFDPGQGLPMFNGDELKAFIAQATWLAVNDYEWQVVQQKTGWTAGDALNHVRALIVTRGAEGSVIHTADGELHVPCAKPAAIVDPTGCGDAYRAGLLHGLLHELDWETTGRIASLLGAIKIEFRGTQNHRFTPQEFERRYRENFRVDLSLATSGTHLS
ncbi:adenosine kinase [Steroidobacter denitrificans]|uniref:Adenosine kinase n=1 Tax=Steroidobacter denitrificans TaxID=465721 RepID=A0A127F8B6_STEDE|nr:carbohydrate kinase family protein [Steroidobacter denitrificans]AMN45881.1 adenosine kinase [Steroidobacter denitrificans]